jgi:two-component system, NarL family, nitrate/nitrite response regulator NarL
MKIILVDDHVLFREGLVSLLKTQPDIQVVGEAGTVQEAIALVNRQQPDIVLMDFGLPDGSGVEATKAILNDKPGTLIVFLTVHDSDERLLSAIRSGARGYLLKNLPTAKLVASLRGLAHHEAAMSRSMMFRVLEAFTEDLHMTRNSESGLSSLSLRELEILREIATDATNQEIAGTLSISEMTVKNHVHSILRKLSLKNRRQASNYARRQGLVSFRVN